MTKRDLFEDIATTVCCKPPKMTHEECFQTFARNNSLCREHNACRIHEKTEEQLQYVAAGCQENVFLKACPGSGKTEVIGLKAAYEIQRWKKPLGGLAVLTFTRNAADVISSRISQFTGNRGLAFPHGVRTFDAWLQGYVANPFAHLVTGYEGKDGDRSIRVIEESSTHPFLGHYETERPYKKRGKVRANSYYIDADSEQVYIRQGYAPYSSIELEDRQLSDFRQTKKKFEKAGFATYRDIESICLRLFEDDDIALASVLARRFPVIIIDECQDLSAIQLAILDHIVKAGAVIHLVGDLNQAIYGFRETHPEKVLDFGKNHRFSEEWTLSQNFRSVQPIVDLCGQLTNQKATSGIGNGGAYPACVCFQYSPDDLESMIDEFIEHLHSHNILIEDAIVLARGKSLIAKLRPEVNEKLNLNQRLPAAIKLWQSNDSTAMDESLKCMGDFVASKFFPTDPIDTRNHSCPKDIANPIQWRLFLARILDLCVNHDELSDLSKKWSDWAPIVRNCFAEQLLVCTEMLSDFTDDAKGKLPALNGNKFKVPSNKGEIPVQETLGILTPANSQKIRITTFHQVKGQTFDAVLVVSAETSKGSKGGHWKEWIKDRTKEHARLAYVASSRPRNLLVWATPKLSATEKARLMDLGFVMIDGENITEDLT